jgi:Niemann-Pick C1 protein
MTKIMWFSALLGTILWVVAFGDDGHCIWYRQCTLGNKAKNCYYDGPAKRVLNDTENGEAMLEVLKSFCPNLYKGNDTVTCCDYQQLKTLVSSMNFPAPLYSPCPSCWVDYRDLFCASTCHPQQSKFLKVEATNESVTPPYCPHPPCDVLRIAYYLTEEYANTLYNACDHVQLPSSNQRVITSFCGGKTADECNATYFLQFQGSISNGFAPFQIDFTITNHEDGFEPYNQKLYKCNETLNGTRCGAACSCSDCPTACSSFASIPKEKSQFKIGPLDGVAMIMIIIYCAFALVFIVIVIVVYVNQGNQEQPRRNVWSDTRYNGVGIQPKTQSPYASVQKDIGDINDHQRLLESSSGSINGEYGAVNNEDQQLLKKDKGYMKPGCISGMGVRLEAILIRFFKWWGTFCATHPFLVTITCIAVVTVLSLGMLKLTVTTDPVKLWSAPNSQSRQERDYFDSHFGPFYRTEQVIIRAPKVKPFNYTQNSAFTVKTLFGGVFEREVMEEVFWLQKNITSLKTENNITLNDICFQPLKPDNDHCAIESVWQYFQNNFTNFNKTIRDSFGLFVADYHSHLLYCFNDPTSVNDTLLHQPCLGAYGGLVPPDVALGGYDDSVKPPPYSLANTLFITIIVNNHLDESRNKDAEAWEKVFIDYMKNFKGKNITVAFTSERSVSDEINRESNSEMKTVAISYALMFLYVAIFLGRIRSLFAILLGEFHLIPRLFIESKISLGFAGVLIVMSAVVSSIGLFSYFGQPVTLIIVEVIPFLVLAVGVDNIFILVQAFQRHKLPKNPDLRVEVGNVLGSVAPSMLLTGLAESIAFFLGALTSMPAVRSFSLFAGMAIFLDFLLQVTFFVALLYWDARRQFANRTDVLCCIPISVSEQDDSDKEENSHSYLYCFFRDYYSHFLLHDIVRAIVVKLMHCVHLL